VAGSLAFLALLFVPCAQGQTVYKCSENGAVTYQDGPCSDLKGKVVDTRPAAKGFEAPKSVPRAREQVAAQGQPQRQQGRAPESGQT
jgi:hypothetical protein